MVVTGLIMVTLAAAVIDFNFTIRPIMIHSSHNTGLELQTKVREDFTITEKLPGPSSG